MATDLNIKKEDSFASTDKCISSSSDQDFVPPSPSTSSPKRKRLKCEDMVSPTFASSLNRIGISDKKATYILAASGQPVSRSSIRKARIINRANDAANIKIKTEFTGPLVIHFDSKMLPAIIGEPEIQDRLALVVSGNKTEKLLGIPKINRRTGENIAQASYDAIVDWNLKKSDRGNVFRHYSFKHRSFKGCLRSTRRETSKGTILWLPCRHHIMEVLCSDVFGKLFGPTSGTKVLLFQRFQKFWSNIKQSEYDVCNDGRLKSSLATSTEEVVDFVTGVLSNPNSQIPRDDYRELLDLTLAFLGKPFQNFSFRKPGAYYHARWMSKVIYVLKIYLFRN